MKIKAEYIWIDGKTPTSKLRSKTKNNGKRDRATNMGF